MRSPQLYTGALNDALSQGAHGNAAGLNWTITKLLIQRGTIMLDNLAPDMPPIPIRLGAREPIILNYVKLNRPDSSTSMNRERTIDLQNILIISPFDALSPVLSFPLTRLRFTYTELWHHHIREIDLIRPALYLGQDLFWFSDQFKKQRKPVAAQGVDAPWEMGHFQVDYGRLVINVFGQPKVEFPFYFETQVDNIRLDQLDKISARSVIAIRRLDQDYPDYKIRIVGLTGKLEFSIPPTDVNANNVVPTVHVEKLSWNDIAATNVWSSVTFDPNGIYGKLGGDCEKGYLKGNFEVYYTKRLRVERRLLRRQGRLPADRTKAGGKILRPDRHAGRPHWRQGPGDEDSQLPRPARDGTSRDAGNSFDRRAHETIAGPGRLAGAKRDEAWPRLIPHLSVPDRRFESRLHLGGREGGAEAQRSARPARFLRISPSL